MFENFSLSLKKAFFGILIIIQKNNPTNSEFMLEKISHLLTKLYFITNSSVTSLTQPRQSKLSNSMRSPQHSLKSHKKSINSGFAYGASAKNRAHSLAPTRKITPREDLYTDRRISFKRWCARERVLTRNAVAIEPSSRLVQMSITSDNGRAKSAQSTGFAG